MSCREYVSLKVGDWVTPDSEYGIKKLKLGQEYQVKSIGKLSGPWTEKEVVTSLEDKQGNVFIVKMDFSKLNKVKSKSLNTSSIVQQEYSDGDICLYGERQVVIIGEPNKERQSAQIVDYPFAEYWQPYVEAVPLKDLGMVLWNRFEEEKGDSAQEQYTGGSSDYYKVLVKNPTTLSEPYEAECNDIIEALDMTFAEGNAFKAIWRKAKARQGVQKKGYDNGVYDSEKVVFFGQRMLIQAKADEQ